MSEVATQCMSEHDARRLTERIRIAAVNYADAKDKLMTLVQEAKDGSAHLSLGYASWTGYLQEVLSGEPLRLARSDRPEVVQMLSQEGMPNTVIADTLGVDEKTVRNDLKSMSEYSDIDQQRTVTKTDGKQYTVQPRPEPKPEPAAPQAPKRPPLPEQFFNTIYDLTRNLDRLKKLTEDDRYPANKEKVALKHESDLQRLAATLAEVLQTMNNN